MVEVKILNVFYEIEIQGLVFHSSSPCETQMCQRKLDAFFHTIPNHFGESPTKSCHLHPTTLGSSPQGWRSSVSAMRSPVVEAEAPKDSGSCWVGLSGFLPKCEVIDVLRRLHRLHSASSQVVGISWLNSE